MSTLTLEAGQAALRAALEKAREMGSPSSVAVLDDGRELIAFARMDGALLASAEISQAKAYTARSLNCATKDVDAAAQPGGPLYGLQTSHLAAGRSLVTFGGGVPITVNGEIVGAVGVAGGTPDQDHEIASAGAAAVGSAG
ncbi:heme-binding protein [Geodermatophilus sp. DSM 44513]|uniref:GlcG/HbpS family heme-binding protein n=1 Tax=Geodermatophilus sp. DSM 44513 TaxID=1528104 RepID=UPI0012887D7D|nr:heme-binding protein [Geodermatophilus sp. DSM 44513]WNV75084.1 heme-binding protein [Geodermatophilus sp. DSM 44513]